MKMKDVLSQLLSFPPHPPPPQPISDKEYDQKIRNLYSFLKQAFPQKFVEEIPGGGNLLDVLDPSVNSLPYLFTLLAYFHTVRTRTGENWPAALQPGSEIWSRSLTFLRTFDTVQVRYAGQEWRRLVESVLLSAGAVSNPVLGIQPVRDAMLRLDPGCSTFTSTHMVFTRQCLQARAYHAALPILEKDICHFPAGSDKIAIRRSQKLLCAEHDSSMTFITSTSGLSAKLTYRDHLQYFLYGGMIYLGLKKWEKALHFLEIAVAAPAVTSVSLIMVEAYKKYVLAALLHRGTPLPIPKIAGSQATRAYKAMAKPYDALAEVFKTGNLDRLRAEIEIAQVIWLNDNNTGLVLQVLDAFRKFSVLRLERTFAALSIPDVARRASLEVTNVEETEAFVASLIASGELKGTLIQTNDLSKPTILRFAVSASGSGGPGVSSEARIRDDLAAQKKRLTTLLGHIQASDQRLELGREYIDSLRRVQKRKDTGGGAGKEGSQGQGQGQGAIGGGDGAFDMDEDMMADLQ